MSMQHDPELDDILQDQELSHVADLLRAGRMTDPPLDDAFRSALRRQLMNRAWGMGERKDPWWRKTFGPSTLAWAGAAVGVILIATVVVLMATNNTPGGLTRVVVTSPINDQSAVRLQQPITVNFNQPMDHPSTEAAVQITPATTIAFSWQSNTLLVTPTSGDLAPNTQYQVTIGPGAKTATGEKLASPKTITFVTQPPPAPTPSPTPSANPTPHPVLGQHQLATVQGGASNIQWSPDSKTVYFVSSSGALESVPAAGGDVTVLVPDGVTSAAIASAGDRAAYIRNGKIDILDLKKLVITSELTPTPRPMLVGWARDVLEWAAADGIYTQGVNGSDRIASLSTNGSIVAVSFAPDGAHLAYAQDQALNLLNVTTGKSIVLGLAGAQFLGWSPDGTGVMYSAAQAVVISDVGGKTTSTLPAGEPSWSSQDEILLGSDTDIQEIRPDGTGLTRMAQGTYQFPVWAPDGIDFIYFRGGVLFGATATAAPPRSPALDAAASVVNSFMQARKNQQTDKATSYLTDNGRKAYSSPPGLNLMVTGGQGDPVFSRYYLLTQEFTGSQPDTAEFVVRIVLSRDKLDVSTYEETLNLVRTQGTQQFLVDQATAGPLLTLGRGAAVVGVELTPGTIKITFDSDLKPDTVPAGIVLLDGKGNQVGSAPVYANHTVTIAGLSLKPGVTYKLVVLSTVQDVSGNNVAAEYDLSFVGPGPSHGGNNQREGSPSPPSASPSPSPSPAASS